MKIVSSEIQEVLRCVDSMQIHRFFSNMEYNHVVTKFPNFSLQANIVKSAHICRFESNLGSEVVRVLMSGQLNLAITGLTVLTFMTIHLFQFRVADIGQDWWSSWFIKLAFCRTDDGDVRLVLVTDMLSGKGTRF